MLALMFAAAPSVQHRPVQPCVVVLGNLICMPQSPAYLSLWQLHRVNKDGFGWRFLGLEIVCEIGDWRLDIRFRN
jgi:hypothetical protein